MRMPIVIARVLFTGPIPLTGHEPMTRHCEECSDVAIHAVRRHGSPRCARDDESGVMTARFIESAARQAIPALPVPLQHTS